MDIEIKKKNLPSRLLALVLAAVTVAQFADKLVKEKQE